MLACLPPLMPTCKSFYQRKTENKKEGREPQKGSKVRKKESERKRKGREKGRTIYSSLS